MLFVQPTTSAQADVVLPVPGITITVPGPPRTITLPPVVRTRVITLPPRTVTLPRATVVQRRTVQGPVRQGPVRIVTETVRVGQPRQPRATVVVPARTVRVTVTGQASPAPTVTQTVTGTPQPQRTVTVTAPPQKNTVVLTRTEQIAFSALWLLAGALLAVLALMLMYRLGYWRGDDGNREWLRNAVHDLRQDK